MDHPGEHDAPIPSDWDRLELEASEDAPRRPTTPDLQVPAGTSPAVAAPPVPEQVDSLTLLASGWAEAATVLAVCTGCLGSLLLVGGSPALRLLPWAAGAAVVWWLFAASVLVTVRSGTPGMLLAGVTFARPVRPTRIGWVVAATGLGGLSLGVLNALGGARRNLAARAAGSSVVSREPDGSSRET